MSENRNLLLAVVLSIGILLIFQFMLDPKPKPQGDAAPQATVSADGTPIPQTAPGAAPQAMVPGAPTPISSPKETLNRDIAAGKRITVKNGYVQGSISLEGGRIDDVVLTHYKETLDEDSDNIHLLKPKGLPNQYYADFGWSVDPSAPVNVPTATSVWTADSNELAPGKPVTLTWDNGAGVMFKRVISLDEKYLFTVEQSVENNSGAPVTLYPYSLLSRGKIPASQGFYILHEGPLGVMNDTLSEVSYDDLRDDKTVTESGTGGWIGITDKYWLGVLIPEQTANVTSNYRYSVVNNEPRYQVDYLRGAIVIQPGEAKGVRDHLFAGAKVVDILDEYQEKLNIPLFDRAVDFGWLYFITRPIFLVMDFFYGILGNFGLAIIALTMLIRIILFPLAQTSYKSMSKMRKLQPQLKAMQERYKDDKQRLQQEMMQLYKREKVNPMAGCLPIIPQIFIFFSLYKVLFVTIEMRHAPFFGWIADLSAPDPTNMFELFGLIPWDAPNIMHIGIWPLLMGITMWLQQRLNPQPTDPVQAKLMAFLPIVFTFMLASFAAGLVVYWTVNNILSALQQYAIMRRMGVK